MTTYSIERYKEEHKPQLAQFQKQLWGSSSKANSRYLEWKYEQNPYTPDPLIFVALHRGRVIGMRGMFGALWEIGPRQTELAIPCAADSLVDRDHRKTGLFRELTRFAFDDLREHGYTHVLNLSPSPANYVASVTTMGWRSIGSVRMLHLPSWKSDVTMGVRRLLDYSVVDRLIPLGRRLRSILPSSGFAHLDRHGIRGLDVEHSPITLASEPRPGAMANLVSRVEHKAGIRHVRDERFFEWRYRNPLADYRFIFSDRAAVLEGYLVLGNRIGRSSIYIADWEATDPEVLGGLLQAAIAWSNPRQDLQTWSATLPPERAVALAQAGFEEAPTPSRYSGRLLARSLGNVGAGEAEASLPRDLGDIRNWDLRMIYSDAT